MRQEQPLLARAPRGDERDEETEDEASAHVDREGRPRKVRAERSREHLAETEAHDRPERAARADEEPAHAAILARREGAGNTQEVGR